MEHHGVLQVGAPRLELHGVFLGRHDGPSSRPPPDALHVGTIVRMMIGESGELQRAFDHLLALEKDATSSIALETRVLAVSPDRNMARSRKAAFGRWRMPQWATGGAIAASLALGFAAGYAGEPAPSDAEFAKMLTLTGAGAGSVFLNAMSEPEN